MKVFIVFAALLACCAAEMSVIAPNEVKQPVGRIVYGILATANQFPWQASVQAGNIYGHIDALCGGAIISASRVLTAAHCIVNYEQFVVGVGNNNINTPTMSQTIARVDVDVHPHYQPSTLQNDIAIIRLNYNLTLSAAIAVIRLPRRAQATLNYHAGQQGQIAGWGRINDANLTLPVTLRYTNIAVYTLAACQSVYGSSVATNKTICGIGATDTRANPCGGDSGGGLAWRDTADNLYSIIGIFSFIAEAGCSAGFPSGYTHVASFLDWIMVNAGIDIRD